MKTDFPDWVGWTSAIFPDEGYRCVCTLLYFIKTIIIIFILLNQGILGFQAKVLHIHQLQKWNKKKSMGTRSRVQRHPRTAVPRAMGTRTGARATHSGAAPSPAACRPRLSWPAPVSSGTDLLGLWGRSGGRRGLCWLAWPPRGHSQPTSPRLVPILTVEAEVWGCRPVWPQALGTQWGVGKVCRPW